MLAFAYLARVELLEVKTDEVLPESYLNARRPPLNEALRLEGGLLDEAFARLEAKGYFTPPPRPWQVGVQERGMDARSYAVLDSFGDVVAAVQGLSHAELIVAAVNAYGD